MKATTTRGTVEKKSATGRGSRPGPRIGVGSVEARRYAVMILDVLAGVRTPTDAAKGLSCSLPKYYSVESCALRGFVAGCEPRAGKRGPRPETQIAALQAQVRKLERELSRRQALARLAQRAVGLPGAEPARPEKGKRKRKPTVRALRMSRVLAAEAREPAEQAAPEPREGTETREGEDNGTPHDGA